MSAQVVLPFWENVKVGDTVRLERNRDNQTAEVVVESTQVYYDYGFLSAVSGIDYDSRGGWRVVSINRPEPTLPTEVGSYQLSCFPTADGFSPYTLREGNNWSTNDNSYTEDEMRELTEMGTLDRLVPGKEILARLQDWFDGDDAQWDSVMEEIRQDYKLDY